MQNYKMWIGGKWVAAESGKTYKVVNPATEEEIAQVPLGDKADVTKAFEAAKKAAPIWAEKSLDERARVLYQFADEINKHVDELVELDVIDHGTPVKVARGLTGGLHQMCEYVAQVPSSV